MRDFGLFVVRLVTGGLLAGHGAQKLFGAFGGHGLRGTTGWMGSMGMRPARLWAFMAGLGEFAGGTLTSLGFLHPIGPILMMAPMAMATGKVHWGKPIWGTEGGAELPVTNMAVATGLTFTRPGRFSLDSMLGIKVPFPIVLLVGLTTAVGIGLGLTGRGTEVLEKVEEAVVPPGTGEAGIGATSTAGSGTAAGAR